MLDRLRRHGPLGVALAALVLLAAGCDDREEVAPEDRRLFLSASRTAVCPDIDDSANNDVALIATVFAEDGQTQENAPVTIVTDSTSPPIELQGVTDDRGQYRPVVNVTRPPEIWDWTATIENGETDTVRFLVPPYPLMAVTAPGTPVEVGETFPVEIQVTGACQVNRLDFELDYAEDADSDATGDFIDYVEGEFERGTLLEEDGDGTNENTFVNEQEMGETLRIEYGRIGEPEFGTSRSGLYLILTFEAKTPGRAVIRFESAVVTPSSLIGGSSRPFDLFDPPDGGPARVFNSFVEIVEASGESP
jgi:hypothetical protein